MHFPIGAFVNFLLLAGVLIYFLRKPMKEALSQKHDEWKNQIDQAEALRQKTENLFSQYESKIANLNKEVQNILQEARDQGEKEKEAILQRAKKVAEQILLQAEQRAVTEGKKAEKKLQSQALAEAISKAKSDIQKSFSSKEQKVFLDNFVNELKEKHVE